MAASAIAPYFARPWIGFRCWPVRAKTFGCAIARRRAGAPSMPPRSSLPSRFVKINPGRGKSPIFFTAANGVNCGTSPFPRSTGNRVPAVVVCTCWLVAPIPYASGKGKRKYYRDPAFLLSTAPAVDAEPLLQAYLDRWQIEVNHREEKDTLGVGQAQLRNPLSVP